MTHTITKRHEEAAWSEWSFHRKSLRQIGKLPFTDKNIKTVHTSMETEQADRPSSLFSYKMWKRDTVSVSENKVNFI